MNRVQVSERIGLVSVRIHGRSALTLCSRYSWLQNYSPNCTESNQASFPLRSTYSTRDDSERKEPNVARDTARICIMYHPSWPRHVAYHQWGPLSLHGLFSGMRVTEQIAWLHCAYTFRLFTVSRTGIRLEENDELSSST